MELTALQHPGRFSLKELLWLYGAILQRSGISFFPHTKEAGAGSRGFRCAGRVSFGKSVHFSYVPGSTPGRCFGLPHRAGGCSRGQDQPRSMASPADGRQWAAHPVMGRGSRAHLGTGCCSRHGKAALCPPLPPVPALQTGKVESGCGELPGLSTLSLLPPTFPPFSPSSPSPSPSRCSITHPGPPATFLPPLFLLFPLRDRWGRCPSSARQETQCLGMPWPAMLPARSQASRCLCARTDPRRGLLQVGTRLELSLVQGRLWLSGRAAGCAFSGMLTSSQEQQASRMELLSRMLYFCPPGPRDGGTCPQGGTYPSGWGACAVMPAGSPSFPTAGCLPPARRRPARADSERKQKLLDVSGAGGEAKQNQAGYFKPDLISPLSLSGPALATLSHPRPRQLPFSGASRGREQHF